MLGALAERVFVELADLTWTLDTMHHVLSFDLPMFASGSTDFDVDILQVRPAQTPSKVLAALRQPEERPRHFPESPFFDRDFTPEYLSILIFTCSCSCCRKEFAVGKYYTTVQQ